MSPRLEAFRRLHTCPVRKGPMKKMTNEELDICEAFITENDELTYAEFSAKLNRWYLNDVKKPKNLYTMWAMLSEANSILFTRRIQR